MGLGEVNMSLKVDKSGNPTETTIIPFERIASFIHVIRGQKVILDRDLAVLYDVETRALNQAVKRNEGRFPPDFMFELNRDEIMRISQSVISSPDLKFSKRVNAFTEQGVAMLSGVLHSPRAVEVNVAIMRAFVRLREFLASQAKLGKKLAEIESRIGEHHESIHVLFEAIQQLTSERPPAIGFQYVGGGDTGEDNGKAAKEGRAKYRTVRRLGK
jgi:hypothetical protein